AARAPPRRSCAAWLSASWSLRFLHPVIRRMVRPAEHLARIGRHSEVRQYLRLTCEPYLRPFPTGFALVGRRARGNGARFVHLDSTSTAESVAPAVHQIGGKRIEIDTVLQGQLAQIGAH